MESYVLNELYEKLFSDSSIKKLSIMLNDYNQNKVKDSKEELSYATKELTTIIEKISTIIKLVADSGISVETVKNELKQLEERKNFYEGYIAELTLHNKTNIITEAMINDLINQSKEFIKTKNIAECRNFIESYIEKVIVYANRVEVLFKINVPDKKMDTVSALKIEESIETIRKEYKAV